MSYTAINVPYCALINTMTTRHSEVISCQAWRFVLCGVAGFLVSVGLPWMVKALGQGDTAQGYQYGVGVLCAIAVAMFLCCFFWVRERVSLDVMGKFTLREHIAGLRKNDQLLLMLVMSFLLINVFNIRGGGYMYFITYVLGGSTGYTSLFFTMVTFASIAGSVIINLLSRRFDTVKLYYYTNLVLAALAVAMWFFANRAGVPDPVAGRHPRQRHYSRLYPAAALFADGLLRRLRRMENRRAFFRDELRL